MAYMDQTKKAAIAAELKKAMPKGWKYTLRVRHHSSITMTIQSAPVDLWTLCTYEGKSAGYIQLNEYYLEHAYDDEEIVRVLKAAKAALNTGNWDKSDIQTDYFNVGHYVHIHVGSFERPFVVSAMPAAPVAPVTTSQEPIQETVTATEAAAAQESSDDSLTPDELLAAAQSLWKDACVYECIDPESKFVCFSRGNRFAEFYGIAMSRYFAAQKRG